MTPEQRRLYAAALQIGRRFGVGGGTWTYRPPVVNTPAASAAAAPPEQRRGYVVRERLVQVGQAAPAAPAPAERWRLIGLSGEAFAAGGTIVSGDLAFRLGPIDTDQGYPTGIVEQVPA